MAGTSIYKVIIVGGGASGLAAASKLLKNGVKNCLLLEAQNTLGGRIKTVAHGDHFLEYGAQWVHGEDGNVIYSFAKENNLLDEERNLKPSGIGETLFVREDTAIVDEDVVRMFQMQMANLSEEAEKALVDHHDSVGNYYTTKFSEENKLGDIGMELLDWYGRFQCCIDGTDTWFDASCVGSTIYEECPGNQVINWNDGYITLISHFQTDIPKEVIRLRSPVNKIRWKDLGSSSDVPASLVEVELTSGEVLRGEHVIVTSSLAVLQTSHLSLFEPKLPTRKVDAISGLGIDVVDKIFLEFSTCWWKGRDGFSFLRRNPLKEFNSENWEKGVLGFYEVYNQSQILCAWLTGKAAKCMEEATVEEVEAKCMTLLRRYLGPHYDIPEPIWCDRTQWYSNPFTRGSYSFRSVKSEALKVTAEDLAYPLCNDEGIPVVCFAGEATHEKYFSTAHGAVETGWREADRVLAHIRSYSREASITGSISHDVIIIGGGVSGLAAAKELEDNGINSICILEASDHIGGRVQTVECSGGGFVDLGAQWIHGQKENDLYEIAYPRGLIGDRVSVDGEGDFYTDDGDPIDDSLVSEVLQVLSDLKEEMESFSDIDVFPPSMGHYLRSRFEEYKKSKTNLTSHKSQLMDAIFQWDNRWERIDNACDSLDQLSAKRWEDFVICEGPYNMNPKYGMSSIMQSIRSNVQAPVYFNSEVVEINYPNNVYVGSCGRYQRRDGSLPLIIKCRNGARYICHHVIVTCSLGFLKKHKNAIFKPRLPPSVDEAISNLGYGVIDKIFLEFEKPFWKPDFTGVHLVWTGKEIPDFDRTFPGTNLKNGQIVKPEDFWYRAISSFDPVYGHKSILCGWIGGSEAEYMELLDDDEVKKVCMFLLKKFTGQHIPDPVKIYRSKWATNPFICGSYSNRSSSSDQIKNNLIEVMNTPLYSNTDSGKFPAVVFAGEAYSENYYSTVHGAISNGRDQAKHIINFIRTTRTEHKNLRSKL